MALCFGRQKGSGDVTIHFFFLSHLLETRPSECCFLALLFFKCGCTNNFYIAKQQLNW